MHQEPFSLRSTTLTTSICINRTLSIGPQFRPQDSKQTSIESACINCSAVPHNLAVIFRPCCRRQAKANSCNQRTTGRQCCKCAEEAGSQGSPQPTPAAGTAPQEHSQEDVGCKPFSLSPMPYLTCSWSSPAVMLQSVHLSCTGCVGVRLFSCQPVRHVGEVKPYAVQMVTANHYPIINQSILKSFGPIMTIGLIVCSISKPHEFTSGYLLGPTVRKRMLCIHSSTRW